MTTLVQLPTKAALDKDAVQETLSTALERASAGEIEGVIITLRTAQGYEYIRLGFGYLEAIAMLDRHKHNLHLSWDKEL